MRAPEILEQGAKTYRERNAIYGDNYTRFGAILFAMFPKGLELKTADDFNRFGLFFQCVCKQSRYAENLLAGGHYDSALDLSVYAAMLAECTTEEKNGA